MTTIDVSCPYCETTFHLKPEMAGTAMRCPECKQVFTVAANIELGASPPPPPPPFQMTFDVPYEKIEAPPPVILDAEVVPTAVPIPTALPVTVPSRAVPLPPIQVAKPLPPKPPAAQPVVAKRVKPPKAKVIPPKELPKRAKLQADDGPKEVDWQSAAPPPVDGEPSVVEPVTAAKPEVIDYELPKPRRNVWPLVLTGLIMSIVILGGGTVAKLIWDHSRQEELSAKDADTAFRDRNYPESVRLYDELIAKYADSGDLAKYKFFSSLSGLQVAMSTVTLKDEPAVGRAKWDAFLNEYSNSPLSKTDDNGYGVDIFDVGRKLIDGYFGHAEAKLAAYRSDTTKLEALTTAEKTIVDAKALIPNVERYRPKDVKPLEEARAKIDSLGAEFARERKRNDVLAPYRDLAVDPIEERIAEFGATLARTGFKDDSEALTMMTMATTKLRTLMKPRPDVATPVPAAKESDATVTTTSLPMGRVPPLAGPPDLLPETVFATARGRLFAMDADTGELLWSVFTGRTGTLNPVRVSTSEGGTEIVLVPSLRDGQSSLTARVVRSGEAYWHQPLDSPLAGPPAVVGSRIYVPLADAIGTILEFDIVTGNRISSFRLRQRIGPGLVRVPGTTQILIAAEARRLFLIDVSPLTPEGDRLPMRLLHVMTTNHSELSLRVPPVFCGASADAGPKSVLLLQSEGAKSTLLRAIALPDTVPAADVLANETPAVELGVAKLAGQVTFPPSADGERVAVITDTGAFGYYATNTPGNLDSGLFAIPATNLPPETRDPTPSLVVASAEDSLWVFSNGKRLLLRMTLTPQSGFKLLPRGTPLPWGVPMQPATPLARRNTVAVVDRSETGDTVRVGVFDLAGGRIKWDRTLGIVATAAPLPQSDGSAIVVDNDAGIVKLTAKDEKFAEPVRIAAPIEPSLGAAHTASTKDVVWVLLPEAPEANGIRMRMRCVRESKLVLDTTAVSPAALAGDLRMLGDSLLVPLADGFLYRFDEVAKKFVAGPMWRNPQALKDARCGVTVSGDEIYATDGERRVGRWRWPADKTAEWTTLGSPLVARSNIVLAPAIVGKQVLVAESNAIALFDPARPDEAIRRWRTPAIPIGKPTLGFQTLGNMVVFAIDQRHLVAIRPDAEEAAWIVERPAAESDLLGLEVHGDVLLVTDIMGTVSAYDPAGKLLGRRLAVSHDFLPRTAATALTSHLLLMPTVDGSVLLLPAIPNGK
ncbi:hypothetical protein BH11PLA2_BH11PLA2_43040 [soil metagenome]